MTENLPNSDYGLDYQQTAWAQQLQVNPRKTVVGSQSTHNTSWTAKTQPETIHSPYHSSFIGSSTAKNSSISSINVPSNLQQPGTFPTHHNVQPSLYTDEAVAAFSHTPSSSRTNHQSTSFATAPNGPSSHPQLYPIPSVRAPLPAMVSHMKTSPPADTTQMSTLPSLPIPELHPSLTQPSTQYVHPTCLGTQLSSSKLYGNESRNEASLYYNYLNSNSHQLPQPVNNVYRLNGNYPGGMGSMQQEFARMDVGMQQTRFIDLMQERNLMKYGTGDEEIALPPTVCNPDARCSPSIFRCTLSSVPQTQELLKKSRLPFGLTLQPFRDMKNLNIVQTSTIVRCRYCRTYINPYIYFPDPRHWKCNICYRVNDLPDDFNWDPATKSFGEPTRRPEIRNATVEFIAPSEYMLRPPQAAVYVFVMDVCHNAIETGYLYTFTEQLLIALEHLPGDERTMIGFIAADSAIHFIQFRGKLIPRQLIVEEFSDIFLPANCGLLVNLQKNIDAIRSFVQSLPTLYESNSSTHCCLGAALTAAHKLIADIGGRITVLLTVIPDIGPGALKSREDPNQRAANEVLNLSPASDYYKRLALECTGHQTAVDLFLLNSQYADLSTIDLLAMANVNPDSAIGVQVQMEENLIGVNTACFQAAVLYTSSKGDRRIRIHTLCLPVTKDLPNVFYNFDVKCAVSLLSKMAVERSLAGTSLTDSREAMVNAVVDAFGAYNSAVSQINRTSSVLSPSTSIRLFPLYVLGMLKHLAFAAGQSIKLDNRVAALLLFRSAPLEIIDLELYPALYQLNHFDKSDDDPPRLHLSFEHINQNGVYLLDTGSYVYIYISTNVEPSITKQLFDVNTFREIDDEKPFEPLDNPLSQRVHNFLRKLLVYRTMYAPVILIREDSSLRDLFSRRLIDDRTETSHSYIEFLNHIRQEMQK